MVARDMKKHAFLFIHPTRKMVKAESADTAIISTGKCSTGINVNHLLFSPPSYVLPVSAEYVASTVLNTFRFFSLHINLYVIALKLSEFLFLKNGFSRIYQINCQIESEEDEGEQHSGSHCHSLHGFPRIRFFQLVYILCVSLVYRIKRPENHKCY